MRIRRIAAIGLWMTLAISVCARDASPAGPYVTVYRDDAVAFQVRRDRIKSLGDDVHHLWLRWLWAQPQPWKNQQETARVIVAHVDCAHNRVRELATLHKDQSGKIFDVEEVTSAEEAPWKSFEPGTGAAAAIQRLCEFVPKLAERQGSEEP
jgi:hypothetical protein